MPYTIALLFLLLYFMMCQILPLKADVNSYDIIKKNDVRCIEDKMRINKNDQILH